MNRLSLYLFSTLVTGVVLSATAAEKTPRERGEEAVRGRPALSPSTWSLKSYQEVWKQWGLKERPANHEAAFRERYGLHAAPYDNGGLPMGLHETRRLGKGITTDCLLCHAGTIAGQTVIGLGNSALDLQGLFDEMSAADGATFKLPFQGSYVRGTIDPVTPVAFLMSFRDAELNVGGPYDLGSVKPPSSDPPAWWQLKKKKSRNWTGGLDARSTRVDMATLLHPFNSAAHVKEQEKVFADIHAFVLNIQPPRYPFAIERKLAEQGRKLFDASCARCHGTYGEKGTYPNKVVQLEDIGTDPVLAQSLTPRLIEYFNKSWLAREKGPDGQPYQVEESGGYRAPPLDGVWATAPYLHNGSAPTVYHVLNSKARPKVFTRSYRTDAEAYDSAKLGWKITELQKGPAPGLPPRERRKIYDTMQPGQSNGGHFYGDKLTEAERRAVIEYLKTL